MLNYVAVAVVAWAVSGPLDTPGSPLADHGRGQRRPAHPHRPQRPRGILIAVAAVHRWWLLYRTTLGFEIRTVGANPERPATRACGHGS